MELRQFARLDARFDQPALVAAGPQALVQDSAALLGAYLTLRTPEAEYPGFPQGTAGSRERLLDDWWRQLGLTDHQIGDVRVDALPERCQAATGVVYTLRFTERRARRSVRVLRQYALSDWFDRMEMELLLAEGLPGVDLLHGHTLDASGQLAGVWCCHLPPRGSAVRPLSVQGGTSGL
ncbi:hypothetical protein [Deinococcus ruber]|nr:hypothetical protein [Deinococcus ruber]